MKAGVSSAAAKWMLVAVLVALLCSCVRSTPDELTMDERLERTLVAGPGPFPALAITTTDATTTAYDSAQLVYTARKIGVADADELAALHTAVDAALAEDSTGVPRAVVLRFLLPWQSVDDALGSSEVERSLELVDFSSGRIDDFARNVDSLLAAGAIQEELAPAVRARLTMDLRAVGCDALIDQLGSQPDAFVQVSIVVEIFELFGVACATDASLQRTAHAALATDFASGELRAAAILISAGLIEPFDAFEAELDALEAEPPGVVQLRSVTVLRELVDTLLLAGRNVPEAWKQDVGARVVGEATFVFEDASVLADVIRALRLGGRTSAVEWIVDRYLPQRAQLRDRFLIDQALVGTTSGDLQQVLSSVEISEIVMAVASQARTSGPDMCSGLSDPVLKELRSDLDMFLATRGSIGRPAAIAPAASAAYVVGLCGDQTAMKEIEQVLRLELMQLDADRGSADVLYAYVFASCLTQAAAPGDLVNAARSQADRGIPDDPAQISRILLVGAAGDDCENLW